MVHKNNNIAIGNADVFNGRARSRVVNEKKGVVNENGLIIVLIQQ